MPLKSAVVIAPPRVTPLAWLSPSTVRFLMVTLVESETSITAKMPRPGRQESVSLAVRVAGALMITPPSLSPIRVTSPLPTRSTCSTYSPLAIRMVSPFWAALTAS